MYFDGDGAWMLGFIPLMWFLLLGLAVWLTVRLTPSPSFPKHHESTPAEQRETPEQILDRRFASGEIDAETHAASRRQLKEHAH